MKTKIPQPQTFHIPIDRRRFFKSMALASAGFTLPGYLAEALTTSPIVTQRPYYPLADLAWGALPHSLSQTGTINTNKFTAASNGTLDLYLDAKAAKGFYYVSFRVPGANTGTP